jgi:hypothetical protein
MPGYVYWFQYIANIFLHPASMALVMHIYTHKSCLPFWHRVQLDAIHGMHPLKILSFAGSFLLLFNHDVGLIPGNRYADTPLQGSGSSIHRLPVLIDLEEFNAIFPVATRIAVNCCALRRTGLRSPGARR